MTETKIANPQDQSPASYAGQQLPSCDRVLVQAETRQLSYHKLAKHYSQFFYGRQLPNPNSNTLALSA
jgi:hypothetical protein